MTTQFFGFGGIRGGVLTVGDEISVSYAVRMPPSSKVLQVVTLLFEPLQVTPEPDVQPPPFQ